MLGTIFGVYHVCIKHGSHPPILHSLGINNLLPYEASKREVGTRENQKKLPVLSISNWEVIINYTLE